MTKVENAEVSRAIERSKADENVRLREIYEYASDMITQPGEFILMARTYGLEDERVWLQPNEAVREVIEGSATYDSLPLDVDNEPLKGFFFGYQAEFVGRHEGELKLCEALGGAACRGVDCPLFRNVSKSHSEGSAPICKEYKIMYLR